jgi:hypothetical protein
MNRTFGVAVAVAWLIGMTALVQRDVVPFWTAQEAPSRIFPEIALQVAIHNEAGVRLGTTWVTTTPTESITTTHSTTLLDLRPIATALPWPGPILCDTTLTYVRDGVLDQFRFRLEGTEVPILVVGERCGRDFSCTTTIGQVTNTVPLDGRLSECLAESLRPFTYLRDLHIGQSWRIRLLNPLALLWEQRPEFNMSLATVTGRETIDHRGRPVECFRIEAQGSVAWADDTGRVVRQEVRLPLLGRWVLTDEPYDRDARRAAIAMIRGYRVAGDPDSGE